MEDPEPSRSLLGFSISSWKRVGGEAGWTLSGQVVTALASLLAVRLLTELAPREVFGEATLIVGISTLARNCFVGPFTNAGLLFFHQYANTGRTRWFLREITRLVWLATAPCAVAVVVGYFTWQAVVGGHGRWPLAAAVVGMLLTDSAKVVRFNRLNSERRQKALALWSAADAVLPLAFAALLLALAATAEAYLVGQTLGLLLSLIAFGWLLYPAVRPDDPAAQTEPRPVFIRKMVNYGIAFLPLSLFSWVFNLGDRFVLGALLGNAAVGSYALAYSLASRPLILVCGTVSTFVRPILFDAQSRNQTKKARKVLVMWLALSATLSALSVAGLWLFARLIARLLLAEAYRDAAPAIFPWVGAGYAIYMLVQPIETRLLSLGISGRLVWPAGASAASNLLLNIALIPRFGIVGAAQATAGSACIHLLTASAALMRAERKAPGSAPEDPTAALSS